MEAIKAVHTMIMGCRAVGDKLAQPRSAPPPKNTKSMYEELEAMLVDMQGFHAAL